MGGIVYANKFSYKYNGQMGGICECLDTHGWYMSQCLDTPC